MDALNVADAVNENSFDDSVCSSKSNQEQIELISAPSADRPRRCSDSASESDLGTKHMVAKPERTVHTGRRRRRFVLVLVCCSVCAYLLCTWIGVVDLKWTGMTRIDSLLSPSPRAANGTAASYTAARNNIVADQIRSYREGKGLIVSIHITHHAGTSMCGYMHQVGNVSDFACMTRIGGPNPWTHGEAENNVALVREAGLHMVSWEYGPPAGFPSPPLSGMNWESPDVVSVYISRDPMDRSLAGDGILNVRYGPAEQRSKSQWWDFANSYATNNFALSKLTGGHCARGENTTKDCVLEGSALLRRMTFVLDQACLDEGLVALGRELGLSPPKLRPPKHHSSARERINDPALYDFIKRQMQRDIELYEWSKGISLVTCNETNI